MLLIDGVKYEEWTPTREDEFEQIVKEHAKDIFGEDSIYFDIKQRIRSKAGIGSIPDGYALTFGDTPCWYIVEVELSSHPLYEHIVPQMTKFSRAVNDLNAQRAIVDAMYSEIKSNVFKQTLVQNRIGAQEIHEFLSRLIFNPPILVVVIEKRTKELELKPYMIEYGRLFVPKEKRALFPDCGSPLELETDVGIIKTRFEEGGYIWTGTGKWFGSHPELTAGQKLIIEVAEPEKRYRLKIG